LFQVLARKAKNQYTWKGFGAIPVALQELKVVSNFLKIMFEESFLLKS
jgi:hypothetical protein